MNTDVRHKFLKMRFLLAILSLSLVSISVVGQQRTIKGRLISVDDKSPIPGWNVMEPGTTNGAITDINGEFTLTVTSHPAIIWFPQCFNQLYVAYEDSVDFKEVILGTDIKGQIYKDSRKIEKKLAKARPTRDLWGAVIDKKTKSPIDSCEVKIKGTESVVYSDSKGSFMITVPNNKTIELEIKKGEILQTVTVGTDEDFKKVKLSKRKNLRKP